MGEIDSRVRNVVYEFLKNQVDIKKFAYTTLEKEIIEKLEIKDLAGYPHKSLTTSPDEHISLQACLDDLLSDRIITSIIPSPPVFFRITPHGVQCIKSNKLEPSIPTLNTLFYSLNLHPWVLEVSEDLFKSKHYGEAIFASYKMIENKVKYKVKEKTGCEYSGQKLMTTAFGGDNPILAINDLSSDSEKNEQEGFKFLFMGAMTGIRNLLAHDDERVRDPYETLHYLAFASILANKLKGLSKNKFYALPIQA